jgi:hypothetical protein
MGFYIKGIQAFKRVFLVSMIWGGILPLLLPLVVNIGPNRIITDGITVVSEQYGFFSGYFSLIEFYGAKKLFLLWFEAFAVCSVIAFVVCFTCSIVVRQTPN